MSDKPLKIYIAGAITGQGSDASKQFDQAETELVCAGHEPFNPCRNSMSNEEFAALNQDDQKLVYADTLEKDIRIILDSDGVALLPGWRESRGAMAEHTVAAITGKRISNVQEFVDDPYIPGMVQHQHIPGYPDALRIKAGSGVLRDREYIGDVGYDIETVTACTIGPNEYVNLNSHISVELPPKTWGFVTGRSSTFAKYRLLVIPGVIDGGYRGEIGVGIFNAGKKARFIVGGDRLAQLILLPAITPPVHPVVQLKDSSRGKNGHGSTGV